MTDYISRQAAIDAVMNTEPIVFETKSLEPYQKTKDVTESIYAIPAADVVEVVRCKDCKHFEAINNDDHGWCKMISDLPCGISVRYDDDYCSYGERAEE